jgi:hypothetical protein
MQVVLIGGLLMACGDDSEMRGPGTDAGMNPGTDSGTAQMDGQVAVPDGGQGGDGSTTPGDSSTGRMCGVAGGACDVIAQNCANSTDGCYLASSGEGMPATTMCLAPNMTGGDGAACSFVNDCLPGLTCSNDGFCRRFCCMGASTDCPAGSGQRCVGLADGENIGVCTPSTSCNLMTNEGCTGGQACYVFASDGSLGCFPAGTKTEGMSCGALNECAMGLGCFGTAPGSSVCSRYCRVSMMAADCGGGSRMCQMVNGLNLPADTGVCPPPT